MKRNKEGTFLIVLGIICILGALVFVLVNLQIQKKAEKTSESVLSTIYEEKSADKFSAAEKSCDDAPKAEEPLYVQNPNMEMPVKTIDGTDYIGILKIPSLELELPVISEWDYSRLNISPCRFTGSVYQDNMIICAHNYYSHFGRLKELSYGAEISFNDMDGNEFIYTVVELETLSGDDAEDMMAGDWDLTLFTCTVGGASRVTLRCEKNNDN